jgi:Outer membrane lipoprotein carrier protein LolA-like
MIFGKSNDSLRLRLPAVFLTWSFFLGPVPMSLAETPPQTQRDAVSKDWNVEQLLENLAKNRQAEVRFEETAFSNLLTKPLKTQGILRFSPPATLEKHVTAPYDERYLVEGDKVLVESKKKGSERKSISRTLSLQDYAVLRVFVEAFRSTLANDVVTLQRFYHVTLQGEPQRWVLILHPLDKAVQEMVEYIRFSGEGKQVRSIEILAPDGDRSVMVITTSIQ